MAKKKIRSTPRMRQMASERAQAVQATDSARTVNLEQEYHYVIRDLMQIAVIAVVLIAGLVVLSFFL